MEEIVNLYEIPVYWLSKESLKKKVEKRIVHLKQECVFHETSESAQRFIIDLETYPMRNWEYNHIAGYIKIYIAGWDISFNIYLPFDNIGRIPKYYWNTTRKHYVKDTGLNGQHFYLGNKKTNAEICHSIDEMLTDIVKEYIPKRFVVDRQAFDVLNQRVDYMALLQELR